MGLVSMGEVVPSEWYKTWHLSKKSLSVMLALAYVSLLFSLSSDTYVLMS
jgi:hypothetical protein